MDEAGAGAKGGVESAPGIEQTDDERLPRARGKVHDAGDDAAVGLLGDPGDAIATAEVDPRPAGAAAVGGIKRPLGRQQADDGSVFGPRLAGRASHDESPIGLEGDRIADFGAAEVDEGLAAGAEGRVEIARGREEDVLPRRRSVIGGAEPNGSAPSPLRSLGPRNVRLRASRERKA